MDYKKKIEEVSRGNWAGVPYKDLRRELLEVYSLLDWFFCKPLNEYLNQNEKSVLNSLKQDCPPKKILSALLEKEKADKNRKKVVEKMENDIRG